MRFKWPATTKRKWQIWENFQEFLDILEEIDGPGDTNPKWLLDEIETVGEANLSNQFIKLYRSGKKYSNPNQSTLAYFMGITDERPHNIPVGMRMSQGRLSMPDIDLDVEDRYRDRILEYLRDKYGKERTAQIITFQEIGAKKAVRDSARVLDKPYELGDRLSKAMPPAVFGKQPNLEDCMAATEFRQLYDSDEEARVVVDTAMKLEGLWRDRSMHAGAIVIADRDISDYIPVAKLSDKPDAPVVTQWDYRQVEECGLLKIDLLGLRNLSVIHRTMDSIIENEGEDSNINIKEPFALTDNPDPDVFRMLSHGQNIGVFQMEKSGYRDLMVALKPSTINDIAAMLALYRPGPMGSGVHIEYAKRKNGLKPVKSLHPSLEPIFSETFGLLLYQEQLLQEAKDVAGMDTMEADYLRKAVGKKLPEVMKKQHDRFVQGCIDTVGMPRNVAEQLFTEIEHHADYSFGKSHSFGYGFISYVTAYLKCKYPLEYMAALLSSSHKKPERMRLYLNECRDIGVEVGRPSVNASRHDFSIADNTIVFGLDGIAGFGDATIDLLMKSRDSANPYTNLHDFMRRVSPGILNRKPLLALLKSGALDELLKDDSPSETLNRNERIQVLFDEAAQLGVFLVQHPYSELKDLVMDKVTHTIGDLNEDTSGTVKIAGIVTEVTKRTTKKGQRMYSFQVEDDTSSIEVIAFPKVAVKFTDDNPLQTGQLLIIEGKVRVEVQASEAEVDDEGGDTKAKLIFVFNDSEHIDYSDISTERPIFIKSTRPIDIDRMKKISQVIDSMNGSASVIIDLKLNNGQNAVIKFDKTTSPAAESILRKLIEV